jgi:Zn-dependent peptidase ImmA (M78 family)
MLTEKEMEEEANLFAMCLLIPEDFIRLDMAKIGPLNLDEDARIAKLAVRYGVSLQLMVNRLTRLGYLL